MTSALLVRAPMRPGETGAVVEEIAEALAGRAPETREAGPGETETRVAGRQGTESRQAGVRDVAGPAALAPGDGVATATLFVAGPAGGPDALVWYLEVELDEGRAWRDPAERIAGESPVLTDGVRERLAPPDDWAAFSDRDGSLAVHATLPGRPDAVGRDGDARLVVPAGGAALPVDVVLLSIRVRPGLADRLLRAAVRAMRRLDRIGWIRRRVEAATEPVLEAEAMYTESIFLEREGEASTLLWYMETADYAAAAEAYEEHPGLVARGSAVVLSRIFENPEVLGDPDPGSDHEVLAHAVAPNRG